MGKYLIVDDSPTIRLTLRRILETLDSGDQEIAEAENGSKAIDEFDDPNVDVVFLDIHLGRDRGEEVLRELLRRRPEARVVLVTGAERRDERVADAVSQGAFAYLQKPLRRDDVAQVLAELEHQSRGTRRVR